MRKRKPRRPPGEDRHGRFARLAEGRTNDILHKLDLLGNLASHHYSPTIEDVEKIKNSISEAMEVAFAKLTSSVSVIKAPAKTGGRFKL